MTEKRSNVRPLRRPTTALVHASTAARPTTSTAARPPRCGGRDPRNKRQKLVRAEEAVQKLRDEVARLLQLRQVLQEQAMNRVDASMGSPWRAVKTYFDVFSRGYVPPSPRHHDGAIATTGQAHPDDFLACLMDHEVVGGGFHGVAIMVEQWKRYSTSFVNSKITFTGADVASLDPETNSVTVTARANYSGNLTLAGVQGMFPHIMGHPALVMALIGQQIAGAGRYVFVYDCQAQRVVECTIDIDLISAYAKVIHNAEDLALLFGAALVTPEYYMGDDLPPTQQNQQPSSDGKESDKQMDLARILCTHDDFSDAQPVDHVTLDFATTN